MDPNAQDIVLNWNFQGAELPSGAPTPRAPRAGLIVEIDEANLSEKKEGVNMVLSVADGNVDPSTGKALQRGGYRQIRKYVGFPKPGEPPDSRANQEWLLLFCLCTGQSEQVLKSQTIQYSPLTLLRPGPDGNKKKIAIDYQPEAGDLRTYTDKNGKERKSKDDNVYLITLETRVELNARLSGEASVANPAAHQNGHAAQRTQQPMQQQVVQQQPMQQQVVQQQPFGGGFMPPNGAMPGAQATFPMQGAVQVQQPAPGGIAGQFAGFGQPR